VTDIFQVHSVGIVTARDALTIHWTPHEVWTTALNFSRLDPELARQAYNLGRDAQDWKVTLAQEDLKCSGPDRAKIAPILYRPFDVRYTYYTGRSRGFHCRPRPEVMHHMLAGENVGLTVGRAGQVVGLEDWNIVFCTEHITEFNLYRRGGNNLFPLYLYPTAERADLFTAFAPQERRPNLNEKVVAALAQAYGRAPTPEAILHYIYAVLYAPSYREQYAQFLRGDFPRIPFPAGREVFSAMAALGQRLAALGQRLAALHLLESPELDLPLARFEGEGDGGVARGARDGLRYDPQAQRVCISASQYFAPVSPAVWEYAIGGYQVAAKWLKDRRERSLSVEEVRTYCRILTALARTIEIQADIDDLYLAVEAKPATVEWA
jgi:hypothetical protein